MLKYSNQGVEAMIFRQLLDPATSTYTYLLADEASREAVLIDPVREQLERDVELVEQLGLKLTRALETHVHADHVTAGGLLRERLGCRLVVGERTGVLTADHRAGDGESIRFGRGSLEVRSTPGHTHGCVTYVCGAEGMAFTGDALFIRGCGRTDFQQGGARELYASVHEKIFSLPDDTRLYPGHDYKGRMVTTVAEEKRFNPRLGGDKSLEEFVGIMEKLQLAPPQRIDEAVPANMASGITEPEASRPSTAARDRWAPIRRTDSGVPVVATEWVASRPEGVRLIDVREHVEFCGPYGHIEGAELVPLSSLVGASQSWDRRQPIITICAWGTRSAKAAALLAQRGFAKVVSLEGGMTRWTDEARAVVEVMGDRERQDAEIWRGMGI
jgi:glyoxylase-like metal-dependent hydrolase (beta-lactamase superfamily II)/rhodanese-related sulfurtransferase